MKSKTVESTRQKLEAAISFEDLATSQGVQKVEDFDSLLGHPAAEDESADEFSAMLREWRREGGGSARPQ